jgi:hypothetical protein
MLFNAFLSSAFKAFLSPTFVETALSVFEAVVSKASYWVLMPVQNAVPNSFVPKPLAAIASMVNFNAAERLF